MAAVIDRREQTRQQDRGERIGLSAGRWPTLWTQLGLAAILTVTACLNLLRLGHEGYGNTYYAAAVRSMLQSWHNFFFVSFDPGGFVTVDKPPVGYWIQTASAKLFGFHGWSLLLPQALAGILSVFLLFLLLRRVAGDSAGLIGAAVLTVTPVAVADNRNNTVDSLLVFTLLLAAWCLLRAIDGGRLRWLLFGAALVGLGFNIKMLQAYLVLPAFFLVYAFAAPVRIRTRVAQLSLAGVLLLAVSLSWAVAVDLTPPGLRPYVGSSQHNSELELAFGYNGVQRLLGTRPPGLPAGAGGAGSIRLPERASFSTARPAGSGSPPFPNSGTTPNAPPFRPPPGGAPGFVQGSAGPQRLFDEQLGGQASWLLPLALVGAVAAAIECTRRRRLGSGGLTPPGRLGRTPQHLILWSTWLLTAAGFFSVAGFYHPYYLIMLAPPIAALTGIGVVALWRAAIRPGLLGWFMAPVLLLTAVTQISLLAPFPDWAHHLALPVLVISAAAAVAILIVRYRQRTASPSRSLTRVTAVAAVLGLAGLLIAPVVWSALTVAQADGGGMPAGGPSIFPAFEPGAGPGGPPPAAPIAALNSEQSGLVSYLEANRGSDRFLVAVSSAMEAAPIIIQTGEPVMAMGGFTGGDPILTAATVARDVSSGTVRFFLMGATPFGFSGPAAAGRPPALRAAGGLSAPIFPGQESGATSWVSAHCALVPAEAWRRSSATPPGAGFGPDSGQQLYDCATVGPGG